MQKVHRSKKLTKKSPIVIFRNTVLNDYGKHSEKTELGDHLVQMDTMDMENNNPPQAAH